MAEGLFCTGSAPPPLLLLFVCGNKDDDDDDAHFFRVGGGQKANVGLNYFFPQTGYEARLQKDCCSRTAAPPRVWKKEGGIYLPFCQRQRLFITIISAAVAFLAMTGEDFLSCCFYPQNRCWSDQIGGSGKKEVERFDDDYQRVNRAQTEQT